MGSSLSEQATINFYEWEYLTRGYYHFDTAVEIEPPYTAFKPITQERGTYVDDGETPNIFQRLGNLIKTEAVAEPKEITYPTPLEYIPTTELCGFLITFPTGSDINANLNVELLHFLTYTERPISFEILGTSETIRFQFIVCPEDLLTVESQVKAYFPTVKLTPIDDIFDIGIDYEKEVAIADFGLAMESMLPIQTRDSYQIDPLTSIIATLDNLKSNESALFQIIFHGISAPWVKDMKYAVSDGRGGSFFMEYPEMPKLTQQKTADPLFAVVMRIATQATSLSKSQSIAKELIRNITTVSNSEYNQLMALSNEHYDYDDHLRNVFLRCSNRIGFLLNAKELSQFVHYPNKTVYSSKLVQQEIISKAPPFEAINQKYHIGLNLHEGKETLISLNDESRLRHTHVIGVTGVGKSTLIANMILEDARKGNGCAIFDPHGDIVEDILLRIPDHRKRDVIIIDPSDSDFPIGFNLLGAKTDAEKIVLSSDLVAAFKRHATAWGDNMTAVLSNVINTFLDSDSGGTLIELKRFLLEDQFRSSFLETVSDPSIQYYWEYEYPFVKKGIAPLLTRIDTFLRPKVVRYMLAQKEGIDFRECIENKKIVLIKLSQGLIGEENSYLLGSLFLSKFNQVAQGRQSLAKDKRHPYYLYLDEFQNFITPSIASILSGARKYGLGLILAHQELGQIEVSKTLNSVLSNPYIRICFRLGDNDAKRLQDGFVYFDQNDLQGLGRGEAIVRIGSSSNDFNLQTQVLPKPIEETAVINRQFIISNTRKTFGKPRSEVEALLLSQLPSITPKKRKVKEEVSIKTQPTIEPPSIKKEEDISPIEKKPETPTQVIGEEERSKLIERETDQIIQRDHRHLQTVIKKLGQDRGFKSTLEKPTTNNGKIDVVLEKDDIKIAFEIAVTNKPRYELKNIKKCVADEYTQVLVVSKKPSHLDKIKKLASKELNKKVLKTVHFLAPDEVPVFLDSVAIFPSKNEEIIKGFHVVTDIENSTTFDPKKLKSHIAKALLGKKR